MCVVCASDSRIVVLNERAGELFGRMTERPYRNSIIETCGFLMIFKPLMLKHHNNKQRRFFGYIAVCGVHKKKNLYSKIYGFC